MELSDTIYEVLCNWGGVAGKYLVLYDNEAERAHKGVAWSAVALLGKTVVDS